MKRLLALILVLCMCTAVLSSCASCADEEEKAAAAETELKDIPDEQLIKMIRKGMTDKQKEKFLMEEPSKFGWGHIFKFIDGRVAYIHSDEIEIDNSVERSKIAQLKEGMSYDEVTEILGAKGTGVGSGFLIYGYPLTDGKTLYIYYNYTNGGDKSTWTVDSFSAPTGDEPKAYTTNNFEEFKQHILTTYKGEETSIPVPNFVSNQYRLLEAVDKKDHFSYTYVPKDYVSKGYRNGTVEFNINVFKTEGSYKEYFDLFFATEKEGYALCEFVDVFLFNNNGRCICVSLPSEITLKRKDNPIDTLEELSEYIVIEYFDLSDSSSGEE